MREIFNRQQAEEIKADALWQEIVLKRDCNREMAREVLDRLTEGNPARDRLAEALGGVIELGETNGNK